MEQNIVAGAGCGQLLADAVTALTRELLSVSKDGVYRTSEVQRILDRNTAAFLDTFRRSSEGGGAHMITRSSFDLLLMLLTLYLRIETSSYDSKEPPSEEQKNYRKLAAQEFLKALFASMGEKAPQAEPAPEAKV